MKIRKLTIVLGIVVILTLLFTALPVLPAFATTTYNITLSATQGKIGDSITIHASISPHSVDQAAYIYFSPSNVNTGVLMSTVSSYKKLAAPLVPTTTGDPPNAGNFTQIVTIPSSWEAAADPLDGGTSAHTVIAGTYYIYMSIAGPAGIESIFYKTAFTVTTAALHTFSPSVGPPGTSVTIAGSSFPNSTALVFKYNTTTLTPTGSTSTDASGNFSSVISIPGTAAVGAQTIEVTAGSITLTHAFTVSSSTAASIAVDPVTGDAGLTGVLVTGSGFTGSTALVFRFDSTVITTTSGHSSSLANGTFYSFVTIPSTATAGAHTVSVATGSIQASATFTVGGTGTSDNTLSVNQSTGATGIPITIGGSGFLADHAFTVTWDAASTNFTGTTQNNGFFFGNFTIPKSHNGLHTIIASDGTNTASATYTVEGVSPTTPQPLRPYMDEAVSSPVVFDWADVTDPSAPVTYNLQIGTSANFTTDSIVISKSNILTSAYTLTEADMLKISTGVTYYWREKAVDNAYNESAWTGTNSFKLSVPFSFTGWPLYVTGVIAAILIFVIGILIGRRTAYNY